LVLSPFVRNHCTAGEAPNRNQHWSQIDRLGLDAKRSLVENWIPDSGVQSLDITNGHHRP
jgi:hypothetical protein